MNLPRWVTSLSRSSWGLSWWGARHLLNRKAASEQSLGLTLCGHSCPCPFRRADLSRGARLGTALGLCFPVQQGMGPLKELSQWPDRLAERASLHCKNSTVTRGHCSYWRVTGQKVRRAEGQGQRRLPHLAHRVSLPNTQKGKGNEDRRFCR